MFKFVFTHDVASELNRMTRQHCSEQVNVFHFSTLFNDDRAVSKPYRVGLEEHRTEIIVLILVAGIEVCWVYHFKRVAVDQ